MHIKKPAPKSIRKSAPKPVRKSTPKATSKPVSKPPPKRVSKPVQKKTANKPKPKPAKPKPAKPKPVEQKSAEPVQKPEEKLKFEFGQEPKPSNLSSSKQIYIVVSNSTQSLMAMKRASDDITATIESTTLFTTVWDSSDEQYQLSFNDNQAAIYLNFNDATLIATVQQKISLKCILTILGHQDNNKASFINNSDYFDFENTSNLNQNFTDSYKANFNCKLFNILYITIRDK